MSQGLSTTQRSAPATCPVEDAPRPRATRDVTDVSRASEPGREKDGKQGARGHEKARRVTVLSTMAERNHGATGAKDHDDGAAGPAEMVHRRESAMSTIGDVLEAVARRGV